MNLQVKMTAIFWCGLFFILALAVPSFAQKNEKTKTPVKKTPLTNLPKVVQIDEAALKNLLKPNGKPLLINFWATWCDPCREEFPDLVKISADYKDRIDLVTISLDELSEINNDVPKFLAEMKAEMPSYLLKVPDEGAAIALVTNDWQGGLPFTILFDRNGATAYSKQGKFKTEVLRAEIEKLIVSPAAAK